MLVIVSRLNLNQKQTQNNLGGGITLKGIGVENKRSIIHAMRSGFDDDICLC
jgi:hypothetical protein